MKYIIVCEMINKHVNVEYDNYFFFSLHGQMALELVFMVGESQE